MSHTTKWRPTDDPAVLQELRALVAAAVNDGWTIRRTYNAEPADRAATLEREGFKMMTVAREPAPARGSRCEVALAVWGPDGLGLPEPQVYDSQTFEWMQRMVRTCPVCEAESVDTVRYAFAGRCCAACLPAMRAEHEKPGWYN